MKYKKNRDFYDALHTQKEKPTYLEYIIAVGIQNHDALIEMVMLHSAGGIQYRQWRLSFGLESVIRSPVIQIVTKTGDQETQYLEIRHEPFHFSSFEHCKHGLGYIQGMSPVMVLYWSVILLHAQHPTTKNLREIQY